MRSVFVGAAYRAELAALLDRYKQLALDALDAGRSVTLHVDPHREEIGPEFFGGQFVHDVVYKGWTFGLSIDQYPKTGEGR